MVDELENLRDALRDGDSTAYRSLVRALTEPLFRYVRPQLSDDQAAEDVVQQTFVKIFRYGKRLQPEGDLRTFCFFVATNLVRDERRRESTRRRRESEAAEMQRNARSQADPELAALAAEAMRAAGELPDDLREIALLRLTQGFTATEAAVALGVPEGTVKTRQRKALELLRGKLLSAGVLPAGLDRVGPAEAASAAQVPSSLVIKMEGLVMASIGTKAGVSAGVMALVVLLLLGVIGGGIYAIMHTGESSPPPGIAYTPEDQGQEPDMSGDSPPQARADKARVNDAGAGEAPAPHAGEAPAPQPADEAPASQPDEPDVVRFIIRGRVTDEDGKGIVGAVVRFQDGQTDQIQEQVMRFLDLGKDGALMPGELRMGVVSGVQPKDSEPSFRVLSTGAYTLTDETGYYELQGEGEGDPEHGGYYLNLTASAEGFSPSQSPSGMGQAALRGIIERHFVLNALAADERYVVFRTVPKVDLNWARISVEESHGATGSGTRTSSSSRAPIRLADGEYQIPLPSAGNQTSLRSFTGTLSFDPPGYAPVSVTFEGSRSRRTDLGEIELKEGRIISGSVIDGDSRPLSGALVRLNTGFFDQYFETGADGKFHFDGVGEAPGLLMARHEDRAQATLTISEGEESIFDLRLVMLDGVAVTIDVQRPFSMEPGQSIYVEFLNGDQSGMSDLDREMRMTQAARPLGVDGRILFERVPPGEYTVWAIAEQRLTAPKVLTISDQPVYVSLSFALGGTITGVITDADGRAMVGARVSLLVTDEVFASQRRPPTVKTDETGRYVFTEIEEGSYVVILEGHDRDFSPALIARRTVEVKEAGNVALDIDYGARAPGNVLRGRVGMTDNGPSADIVMVHSVGHGEAMLYAPVGEDGSFEVAGIPSGRHVAWVLNQKAGASVLGRRKIEFDGWSNEIDWDLRLLTYSLTVRFTGEGLDPETVTYALVPELDMRVEEDPVLPLVAIESRSAPGNDGRAKFSALPSGRWWLRAQAEGFGAAWRCIDLHRDQEVTVTLERARGSVRIGISQLPVDLKPDARNMDNICMVAILPAEDGCEIPLHWRPFPMEEGGEHEVQGLAPGNYRVRAYGQAVLLTEKIFSVSADATTRVDLSMQSAARLSINVTNSELTLGEVASVVVRLYDSTGREIIPVGASGMLMRGGPPQVSRDILVTPLPPGVVRVVLELPGFERLVLSATLGAGQTTIARATFVRE